MANASSIKPKVTFTEFNHPPLFGRDCNIDGKKANKEKGRASPMPNPNIPIMGAEPTPLVLVCPNKVPTKGPVQEKETMTKVNAIKKIPINPPLPAFSSALLAQLLGRVNSKAPKKEIAKTKKMAKKTRLETALVEMV